METGTIELLSELPHAAGLQQLCDLTYRIIGNPAFISDLAHTILAYTKCVEINDSVWQTNIVQSRLERNTLRQEREVSSVHVGSAEEHRPVLVEDGHMPYPRIIKTLSYKGQAVGVMVVTAYMRPFEPGDIELTELISAFVLPKMIEERYYISDDAQTVENYLIKLLDGIRFSRERVLKRLDILGCRLKEHAYVLSVCVGHEDEPHPRVELGQLIGAFRAAGCRNVFAYNATLVCLYDSDSDAADWQAQAPELAALLERENLIAGVSRRVTDMERFREYYLQAQRTAEIGLRLGRSDRFFCYDSLASFMLFGCVRRADLGLYCHQKIQELGAYDETHGTELCITLQVYLEQAKSLARTAELLYIHRNTVRYRIRKCMELLHTDLEDGNEMFVYILSLRILEFVKKFPSEKEGAINGKNL